LRSHSVLRARAQREREAPTPAAGTQKTTSKAEKKASRKLAKRVLEDQLRAKMQQLWEEVREAEAGIESGDAGALDRFVGAAGLMIENFRLAKHNFGKNRVSRVDCQPLMRLGHWLRGGIC
jgi:general transcription factor 3C polypeptide 3 (transcription factor C subunit 4)